MRTITPDHSAPNVAARVQLFFAILIIYHILNSWSVKSRGQARSSRVSGRIVSVSPLSRMGGCGKCLCIPLRRHAKVGVTWRLGGLRPSRPQDHAQGLRPRDPLVKLVEDKLFSSGTGSSVNELLAMKNQVVEDYDMLVPTPDTVADLVDGTSMTPAQYRLIGVRVQCSGAV